jgi:ABC-type branched-subunit amino acid transport system substrate-binding protein
MTEGVEVPASAVPCVGCHGRDGRGRPEGGVNPSDLTWEALTRPYGTTHASGRKHPAYDERLLKRAISMGIDPAGNALHVAMPRFQMSHGDMADLVAYLKTLGHAADPGASEAELRLAVVLPPSGPLSPMGEAVRAALAARFERVNQDGGIYGRKIVLRSYVPPAAPDQRKAWTADFLEREEVFAGVGAFLAGADAEMAALFGEKEVPLVGPFTLHPRDASDGGNRYVFHLLPGFEAQTRALTRFAKTLGTAPVTTLPARWTPDDLKRLAAAKADPVLFPGSAAEARDLLRAADRLGWHPRLLLTGAAADTALFEAPPAFEGRLFVALPTNPSGPSPKASAAYRDLAAAAKLPREHISAQLSALAAAEALIEALTRAGRDLTREKLVERLEAFRSFQTGFAPPLTFGPARRLGARGAYVARVDLAGKAFVPAGGWVEAE